MVEKRQKELRDWASRAKKAKLSDEWQRLAIEIKAEDQKLNPIVILTSNPAIQGEPCPVPFNPAINSASAVDVSSTGTAD